MTFQDKLRDVIADVKNLDEGNPRPEYKVMLGQLRSSLYHFESNNVIREHKLPDFVRAFAAWAGSTKAIHRHHELPIEDIPGCATCGHWFCGEHKA